MQGIQYMMNLDKNEQHDQKGFWKYESNGIISANKKEISNEATQICVLLKFLRSKCKKKLRNCMHLVQEWLFFPYKLRNIRQREQPRRLLYLQLI